MNAVKATLPSRAPYKGMGPNRWAGLVLFIGLWVVGGYAGSALWALHTTLTDARAGNERALVHAIDWPAVRQDLAGHVLQPAADPDALPDFGDSFAQAVARRVVQSDVGPNAMVAWAQTDGPTGHWGLRGLRWVSLRRIDARLTGPNGMGLRVGLHLTAWRWRVDRVWPLTS